jgi:hypothetical protein
MHMAPAPPLAFIPPGQQMMRPQQPAAAATGPFLAAAMQQPAAPKAQQVALQLTVCALAGNTLLPDLVRAAEALCGVQVLVLAVAAQSVTLCVVGAPAAAAMARHMILSAAVA